MFSCRGLITLSVHVNLCPQSIDVHIRFFSNSKVPIGVNAMLFVSTRQRCDTQPVHSVPSPRPLSAGIASSLGEGGSILTDLPFFPPQTGTFYKKNKKVGPYTYI